MTRLVVCDLDGTTLNSEGHMADENVQALRRAHAAGAQLLLATGRSVNETAPHVARLGLPVPAVLYNGAVAVRFDESGAIADDGEIFRAWLPAAAAGMALELARELDLVLNWYTATEMLCACTSDKHRELVARYEGLTGDRYRHIGCYSEVAADGAPKLLMLTEDPDGVIALAAERLGEAAHLVRGDFFVEVLRPGVNKGATVQTISEQLGMPLHTHGLAFGDGDNDIEMLRLAHDGVAMRNARDVLKEAATRVSEWTNDEHAVGREVLRALSL